MLSLSATPAEESNYTFLHSPAESVHNLVPRSSIDFASVASMFTP